MRDQTRKADEGKPRLFLVPAELDIAVGRVMTFGAKKYGARTWRGVEMERYQDALARHFAAYKADPDGVDEESGLPHLWHRAVARNAGRGESGTIGMRVMTVSASASATVARRAGRSGIQSSGARARQEIRLIRRLDALGWSSYLLTGGAMDAATLITPWASPSDTV